MSKIANYNCDGLCIEEYCSDRYTHFTTQKINGMGLVLGFCEKHMEDFENETIKANYS